MDPAEKLRILKSAGGDAGLLALAVVDIQCAELSDTERETLKNSVEAIAIPRWCNSRLLAVLTDSTKWQAEAVLAKLRKLGVIEPRPECGLDAVGVDSDVRSALRARLARNYPRRLQSLSKLAYAFFSGVDTPQAEAEAVSHQFVNSPDTATEEAARQLNTWDDAGQNELFIALSTAVKSTAPLALYTHDVPRVFVSYSHADYRFCHKDLMVRIGLLENRGKVNLWCDREISTGDEWNDVIKGKVEGANVFVFLVTTNFLGSNYIRTKEAGRAWERHRNGEASIIPVLLETCSWQDEDWGGLQPVPMLDGRPKPIREWASNQRAKAWLQVEQAIEDVPLPRRTVSQPEPMSKPHS